MLEKIQKVKCSEVEMEYLLTGEENEETIMFVHGVGANLRQFIPQHRYFSKEYKVLSVSLRGHGESTSPINRSASEYTLRKHRDDILEILEYLEVQTVHYVGNSAGGMIGYELFNVRPLLFESFVTFGTTAELQLSRFLTNIIVTIDKTMVKINPLGYCKFMSKYCSKYKDVQEEIYDEFRMSTSVIPYFRKNIGKYSYLKTIEKINIPFLLVQGELDHDINKKLKSTIEEIRNNKYASVIRMAEAGHFANLDKPQEFNKIIENFITMN